MRSSWFFAFLVVISLPATGQVPPGAPDLLQLGAPVGAPGFAGSHPAAAGAVTGTWSVAPGPVLAERSNAAIQEGGVDTSRWRFATGERFALSLPGGKRLDLSFDSRFNPVEGVEVYTGRIDGRAEWLFTLAVDDKEILGRFFVGTRVWILENFSESNQLALHRLDRSLLPKAPVSDAGQPAPSPSLTGESTMTAQSTTPPSCSDFTPTDDNGHARILFLHSPDVATGIDNLVASIVAEFNASADNSDVALNNFISVADIRQVDDTFDGLCREPILLQMRDETGVFQGLSQLMSTSHMDVAFLVVGEDPNATNSEGDLCVENLGRIGGAAWVLKEDGNPAYGMSTGIWALGDLTAIHEIGHIFGGLHEYDDEISDSQAAAGVPDCGRGWAGTTQDWMTVMGGYGPLTCPFGPNESDPSMQPCTRLPIWSNPAISHNGEPAGDADTAHMALALEMTMPTAANWESFPTAKPQSAPQATAIGQFCWGGNYITWTDITAADEYQLVGSTSPSFFDVFLEYFGSGTGTEVIVPESPKFYFRVRGCNGNGCGPWSNGVEAHWFDGCL